VSHVSRLLRRVGLKRWANWLFRRECARSDRRFRQEIAQRDQRWFNSLTEMRTIFTEEAEGVSYGGYPGGDPRDFTPDGECCTPEEIAAHKAACEAWERGDFTEPRHGRHAVEIALKDGTKAVGHGCINPYGIGVYTYHNEESARARDAAALLLGYVFGEPAGRDTGEQK